MDSQESHQITAALVNRAEKGADATQIADAIALLCTEIAAVLTPIIGKRGVAALYKRSLYLAGLLYPWLAGAHNATETEIDFAALKLVLVQQRSTDAAIGGGFLLQKFYEVLATLIGPSLTGRLLRSVWANFLSPPPAQDTSA